MRCCRVRQGIWKADDKGNMLREGRRDRSWQPAYSTAQKIPMAKPYYFVYYDQLKVSGLDRGQEDFVGGKALQNHKIQSFQKLYSSMVDKKL